MKRHIAGRVGAPVVLALGAASACGGSVDLGPGAPSDGGSVSDGTPDSIYDCTIAFESHPDANVSAPATLQFKSPTDATCSASAGCFVSTSLVPFAAGATAQIVVGFQPFARGTTNLEGSVSRSAPGATFWYSESDANGARVWCAQSGTLTVTALETSGSTARITFETSGASMAPTADFAPKNDAHGTVSAGLKCSLMVVVN